MIWEDIIKELQEQISSLALQVAISKAELNQVGRELVELKKVAGLEDDADGVVEK